MTSPARWITTVSPIRTSTALSLDLVLVVQRDVLHDHAADADRLELADRRERPVRPTWISMSVRRSSRARPGICARSPSAAARDEAEPLLPVDPVDLVDDAVDVVVEPARRASMSRMKRSNRPSSGRAWSADWS
jgi:hypothetical protein